MRIITLHDLETEIRRFYVCTGKFGPRGRIVRYEKDLARINVIDVRVNGSYTYRRNLERVLQSMMSIGTKVLVKELTTKEKWLCWTLKVSS